MGRKQCPGCAQPLPFAARRCVRCGWIHTPGSEPRGVRRRWVRTTLTVFTFLAVLGAAAYRLGGNALAEWYAEFALRHLPASFSTFAPSETPTGAFYACVQRVARQVRNRSAVETFPGLSEENTVSLGDGRYRVRSELEAVRDTGERMRRSFSCVVRYERGRWRVEEVEVE
jgi:hypothetical protein